MTDEQKDIMITCCKCHGQGTYQVPYYAYDTTVEWEERDCELCQGLGKISLAFYEDLQWSLRKKR